MSCEFVQSNECEGEDDVNDDEKSAAEQCLSGIRRATSGADAKSWSEAYMNIVCVAERRETLRVIRAPEAKVADA